jgi:hypothetical protein
LIESNKQYKESTQSIGYKWENEIKHTNNCPTDNLCNIGKEVANFQKRDR